MQQLKHDNHFVPQMYLRNWGNKRNQIWSYRLLVPTEKFPKWTREPIGAIAFQRDLYTVISNGQEDDSFERWVEAEFESPAQESLSKVLQEKKLTPSDWARLALFLAAQDVRTPLHYIESTERWAKLLPETMEKTLQESIQQLEEHYRDGKPIPGVSSEPTFFKDTYKISITPSTEPEHHQREIRAEVVAGRKFWVESQRYALTITSKVLLKHKWSIVQPAKGMSWLTSDHPVLRLNYYKEGNYDFKGGWGREGGNLIMPLSPNHLLYTQIGVEAPGYFTMSVDETHKIQRLLAERGFRWLFAHKVLPYVERIRPRAVDLEPFTYEDKKWKDWHQEQSSFET